jgi:hypothetical protein
MAEVSSYNKEEASGHSDSPESFFNSSDTGTDTPEELTVAIDLNEQDAALSNQTQGRQGITPFGVSLMLRTCFRPAARSPESKSTKVVEATRERGTQTTAPPARGQDSDSIPAIVPDTEHYINPSD